MRLGRLDERVGLAVALAARAAQVNDQRLARAPRLRGGVIEREPLRMDGAGGDEEENGGKPAHAGQFRLPESHLEERSLALTRFDTTRPDSRPL